MALEVLTQNIFLVIMGALSIIYFSWLILAFMPKKQNNAKRILPSLSVLIPAHNEEKNIKKTLESVVKANYPKKEVIVIDDGSKDKTAKIVKQFSSKYPFIKLLRTNHEGKARALNVGLAKASSEIIILLDADTTIEENALEEIVQPFSEKNVGASTSTVKVVSTKKILTWFAQVEYAGFYGWNYACDKINAIPVTSPFAAFRRDALKKIGGFKGETAVEDHDLCMHLKKEGYIIRMAPNAVGNTIMPETLKGWLKQRMRWRYGILQVLKEHWDLFLNKKHANFGYYVFPTQIYWYIHSVIYVPLVLFQIFGDYWKYFGVYGNFFSFEALRFLFNWFTLFGMVDFIGRTISGLYPLNLTTILILIVFTLSYSFLLFSVFKFLKKFSWKHLLVIVLFFPYSLMNLVVNVSSIFYYLLKSSTKWQKWEKQL